MNEFWKNIVEASQSLHLFPSPSNNAMNGVREEQIKMDSKAEGSRNKNSSGLKRKSSKKAAPGPLILPPPITIGKQIKKDSSTKKTPISVEGDFLGEDTSSHTSITPEEPIVDSGEQSEDSYLVSGISISAKEEDQDEELDEFEQGTEDPLTEEESIFLKNAGKYISSEPQTEKSKQVRKLKDYQLWIEEFLLEQELEVAFCEELGESEVRKQGDNEPKEKVKPVKPIEYSLVRLPVILSESDLEYEIFDSYQLPASLSTIIKSEWSVHSIEAHVPLPSNIAFIKGMLLLNLDYTCEKQALHSVRVLVPWCQTVEIEWLMKPEIYKSEKKEYMFTVSDSEEPSLHYEYCAEYAKPIQFDLSDIMFIWHEELNKQVNQSRIAIKGVARFSLNLLQEQYVEISLE